jgi:hypothetical protein
MTELTIDGELFLVDGEVTYPGRSFRGHSIEGMLLNSRMVQATFDDANPDTSERWAYPDTGTWDPERNTTEFLQALPAYRECGLLAITVNLQGGSPEGYSSDQPWDNNAFTPEGEIKPAYASRMARVLERTDALGMAVILGVFYFGQDQRLAGESAIVRALGNTVNWLLAAGHRHVLLEIDNECNVRRYDHEILKPARVSELIERARGITRDGKGLLVGTSYGGGFVPLENVVRVSDFLLLHGNGVADPERIAQMVVETRAVSGYRPMPILFNEDDHFDFDQESNNFTAALSQRASWGYFDPGESNYRDGYQSPPVNWGLSSERKRRFFALVRELTGS